MFITIQFLNLIREQKKEIKNLKAELENFKNCDIIEELTEALEESIRLIDYILHMNGDPLSVTLQEDIAKVKKILLHNTSKENDKTT